MKTSSNKEIRSSLSVLRSRLSALGFWLSALGFWLLALSSCRGPEVILPPEPEQKGDTVQSEILGFYLLNEGNMGSNKATLDYYDFTTATYVRNIYSAANPSVAQSLGDVGNDLKIYGKRLYAVINCSNFIEVMSADDATHIGTIDIPNCRYLRFKDGYGYVTSYAGPVTIDPNYTQIGYVAKFDTATLQIIDTCHVGFQPDELEVVGNKLYVANSGGYMVPNYEHTVSVIDLNTFTETHRIDVAVNLHHLRIDKYGILWVSSRGDYYDIQSALYAIDTRSDKLVADLQVPVSNMWLDGDSLYVYGSQFSYFTMTEELSYRIIDIRTKSVVSDAFIPDTVTVVHPYGLMVHPVTKDIYLTDAKNYVTPGTLHCFGNNGALKWSVRTGDIPAHMTFRYK